jgi:hypothetical protein
LPSGSLNFQTSFLSKVKKMTSMSRDQRETDAVAEVAVEVVAAEAAAEALSPRTATEEVDSRLSVSTSPLSLPWLERARL